MDGNQLRRLVYKAAKTYTDQYRLPHYLSRNQTEPTVLFFPGQDALLHGNFLNASYDVICGNLEWARRLHKPHPRRTAPPAKRRAEAMELDSRGDALVEAIEQAGVFKGLTFFASEGAPVGSYEVHTCVGVPTAALESLPALDDSEVERVYVGRSLQHEVISECLQRADRALYLPDPGTDLNIIGTAEDLIMTAAKRLTDGAAYRATRWLCDLFSSVNEFASLRYERGGAKGHIVIASHKMAADRLQVRFQQPVPINRARSMRKLLELTDDSTSVLHAARVPTPARARHQERPRDQARDRYRAFCSDAGRGHPDDDRQAALRESPAASITLRRVSITLPMMRRVWSEARQRMTWATSSGSTTRI